MALWVERERWLLGGKLCCAWPVPAVTAPPHRRVRAHCHAICLLALQVMPGPGEPKSVQSFPSGLTAIPLKYGSPMGYLDSILGVGGTGATVVTYTCPAGTQAAGFHVAWEPATAAAGGNVTGPLDLATGIRIHCRAASNCTAIGT